MEPGEPISRADLAALADDLLEESEEDPQELALLLDTLDPAIRRELLISDFLNACQAFFYYFRKFPGDLEMERLILQPASALVTGVIIAGMDLLEVVFRVEDDQPVMSVRDGEQVLVNYRGKDAYARAVRFMDEAS
jgi:hypothetical protein